MLHQAKIQDKSKEVVVKSKNFTIKANDPASFMFNLHNLPGWVTDYERTMNPYARRKL